MPARFSTCWTPGLASFRKQSMDPACCQNPKSIHGLEHAHASDLPPWLSSSWESEHRTLSWRNSVISDCLALQLSSPPRICRIHNFSPKGKTGSVIHMHSFQSNGNGKMFVHWELQDLSFLCKKCSLLKSKLFISNWFKSSFWTSNVRCDSLFLCVVTPFPEETNTSGPVLSRGRATGIKRNN